MKAIYKALLGLALMTAVPTSFTSCREDAPSVNQTADITIKNEFSKLVEAINNGNLKREEAIKKITEAIDGMNKSSSEASCHRRGDQLPETPAQGEATAHRKGHR